MRYPEKGRNTRAVVKNDAVNACQAFAASFLSCAPSGARF